MIGLKKRQKKAQEEARAAAAAVAEEEKKMDEDDESKNGCGEEKSSKNGRGRGRGRGRGVSIFGVKKGGKKAATGKRKMRPGEFRIQKDVSELDGGECARTIFPNPNDLMNFEVEIRPNDGFWNGYCYKFKFEVPDQYPHEAPKVKCCDKIYHPNIDYQGNVCLNILRADWRPVLNINAVIYGLILLLDAPNPNDPLNHQAAEILRTNPNKFRSNVEKSLRGYSVDGQYFDPPKRA